MTDPSTTDASTTGPGSADPGVTGRRVDHAADAALDQDAQDDLPVTEGERQLVETVRSIERLEESN